MNMVKVSNKRTKVANDFYYLKNKLNKFNYKGVKGSNERMKDVNNYYYDKELLNKLCNLLGK